MAKKAPKNATLKEKDQKSSFAVSLIDYFEIFVFAVALVMILLTFCVRLCVVDGPSMNNTLQHGEKILVSDLFYTPKQGDIIVFHHTSDTVDQFNKPIVKRVIAVGGQHVRIDYIENRVYVSDDAVFEEHEIIDESSYAYFHNGGWKEAGFLHESDVFEVPEGKLFVLGDNRNNSADSRNSAIGMIDERTVLGRAILRIAPFTRFQ
ncbi:MAG: signal peptidase I [Ruminococcaceae bacterium]|nr:signal peptidase I [Oscillospiraceae bacterium]